MRMALRFALLAAGFGWLAAGAPHALARGLLAHAALSLLVVAAGYAWGGPRVYGKVRETGRLPVAATLALWPVHALNALAFHLVRALSRERPYDEVLPGVFLGRRLVRAERALLERIGARAVLDLTSEFEDPDFARALHYRSIPILDHAAPTPAQLAEGVSWLLAAPRPVFVHCALGHGRSATFAAALALATGAAPDADAAEATLRERRPGVRLNPAQRRVLAALPSLPVGAPRDSGGPQPGVA